MSEPTKQQIGDGQDNFGQAAGQMAKAAKQASQEAAKKGAEATANAAAATVKAGVEGGKAVSEIAVGTAVGGPWGAILSAAWAMRHTLFKILICICLALTFLIVMIVSLPSIVADSVFGLSGTQPAEDATLLSSYTEMAEAVSDVVDGAYDLSLSEVERIIADGGYDYDLSMDALINYAQSSAGYDVCYILAAYSASIENLRVGKYTVTELDDEMSEGYRRPDPVTVELVTDETLTVNVHNEKVTVDVPKTGDDSNLWIWGSLLGLSALGAGALVFVDYKRRKRIVKK